MSKLGPYRINTNSTRRIRLPLGIGQTKPRHYRDMLKVARENLDNPLYAFKVLSRGVCDGCALGVAGFHDWTIEGVHLCMTRLNLLRLNTMPALDPALLGDLSSLRGMDNRALRDLGRLAHPMLRCRGDAGFRRITWDHAIARIAQKINAIDAGPNDTSNGESNRRDDPHRDRIAFYLTSRGITNEVYYVAQKVARFLGTNNIDNAARLCHSPSTGAMKQTLGWAASTCSYRDWFGTNLIVFFGSNPANDQPVAMKYLELAKRQGTKVVLVNPYCEPGMQRYWVPSSWRSAILGTDIADWWFPVSQGGDIAFLYGTLKVLIENGGCDERFIAKHVVGFDALREATRQLEWSELERSSGLPRDAMVEFAQILREAKTGVFVWSMGITQHAFGGENVQMILNLGLARGYIGREKCGMMPIRGHSGVQGGAEMGAYATAFPGGKPINSANATQLSSQYGFAVPDRRGLSAPEMVEAAHRGQLDLLYCVGGNFLRTLPDPYYVAEAMARVPLRVHQDIILTDQMFLESDEVILLPAATRYEQEGGGTQTTTERRVIFGPQIPRQVGEARSEWKILQDLAAAVDPQRAHLLGCGSGQEIRNEIARIIPLYDGIQHLRQLGDSFQYGGERLCEGGRFNTPDGKAHLRAVPLPSRSQEDGWFRLSTRRGKQFNTLIYAEIDPLTGAQRDAVFMHPDDAADLHLKHDDPVTLVSQAGRFSGRIFLAPIARRNLQVHFPEGNVLLRRGSCDPTGGVPDYNVDVRVEHTQ